MIQGHTLYGFYTFQFFLREVRLYFRISQIKLAVLKIVNLRFVAQDQSTLVNVLYTPDNSVHSAVRDCCLTIFNQDELVDSVVRAFCTLLILCLFILLVTGRGKLKSLTKNIDFSFSFQIYKFLCRILFHILSSIIKYAFFTFYFKIIIGSQELAKTIIEVPSPSLSQ